MADDRADPIMANYDPEAEEHIMGLINGDILYVPTEQDEEEDISSYLNLDGQDEGITRSSPPRDRIKLTGGYLVRGSRRMSASRGYNLSSADRVVSSGYRHGLYLEFYGRRWPSRRRQPGPIGRTAVLAPRLWCPGNYQPVFGLKQWCSL